MNMADQSKGLPMTSKWDPQKLQAETAYLQDLQTKPFFPRIRGYMKLTGPAWLQSAMTLGAGSAAASVMAGKFFGYQLLWVQPIAMFLGIMMLGALGNVVLSTGERPYKSFSRELHVSIAFLWALGTVVASVIWHFPQYGLAGAACWDLADLTANLAGVPEDSLFYKADKLVKFAAGALILGLSIFITWNYGSRAKGIKLYEGFIRWVIRLVIISFAAVVISTIPRIDWGALFRGFFVPSIPEGKGALTTVLGAFGAAVGINMTFLYPYSLLAKGWGKNHKGLSRWDLFSSMFLPFVLVTSLVIIAMANTVYDPAVVGVQEKIKPVEVAQGLTGVLGMWGGRIVFDLGFMGMACGAISTHMVVCGFTFCEMFGLEYTPKRYRMFTLVPAIGILGVFFESPIWMPVVASAICLTMLPLAYIAFLIMNNKKSYIGDATGKGLKRAIFNIVLLIALTAATVGSAIKFKQGVIDKIPKLFDKPAATQVANK
jgi:Mn2+/Fe2+ NRAMP family transporter